MIVFLRWFIVFISKKSLAVRIEERPMCYPLLVAHMMEKKMNVPFIDRPPTFADPQVKPASYTGAGLILLLPPTSSHARPIASEKLFSSPGWSFSVFLQSSQPKAVFPYLRRMRRIA